MLFPHLSPTRQATLVTLESLQVLFLAIHDWVPLGRLNDVRAVRREDTTTRLVVVTIIQTAPFAIGLLYSVIHLGSRYPGWLLWYLLISYAILFVGQLQAWWVPYLIKPDPARAERYRHMFANTHSFLPQRNGIVPNTAHILLHIATIATLCVLLL